MQTSLVEIYRTGTPVSYLKGVSHTHYNVCANTYWALQQCTKILHETAYEKLLKAPSIAHGTEARLYRWKMMRGTPSEYLDEIVDMDLFIKICDDPGISILSSNKRKYKGEWIYDDEFDNCHDQAFTHFLSEKIYYYEFFLDMVREVNWMEKIVPNMLKESCFVVCGFAHLKGLISLLQEEGFTCKNIVQSHPVFI